MALTITKQIVNSVGLQNIRVDFYYSDEASSPPNVLHCAVTIINPDGTLTSYDNQLADFGLSGPTQTATLNVLSALVNFAGSQLGYSGTAS